MKDYFKTVWGAVSDGAFGMLPFYVAASIYSSAHLLIEDSYDIHDLDDAVPDHLASFQTVAVLTGGYFMMFFFVTGIEVRRILSRESCVIYSCTIGSSVEPNHGM